MSRTALLQLAKEPHSYQSYHSYYGAMAGINEVSGRWHGRVWVMSYPLRNGDEGREEVLQQQTATEEER
jgi:hypothetical protein